MKTDYGWIGGGNGTNSSGFSGLPGGCRRWYDGNFNDAGSLGNWWSSSPVGPDAWYRILANNSEPVFPSYLDRQNGFSVRCVRDAE